eukprot:TRINITY_DN33602_c0_g1_i1.p1 TRINITY_DN33602_c0_g1~~TRINITY_DN33602_c0_g1_i1.p1  ORF type:complete len:172 (+),score=57.03 TRINITY_DN33602_c0_g1_i1:64-516(+)
MARGRASNSRSSSSRPAPAAAPPAQHHAPPAQAPVVQSGGGMGSGLGGAMMQGAAIGAGAEVGRMALGSMFGGGGGHQQPQQGYDQQYQQGYEEPQQGTNWLLWGGVAAATAGGAFYLSRGMMAQRAFLPLLATPVASKRTTFRKPEEEQ